MGKREAEKSNVQIEEGAAEQKQAESRAGGDVSVVVKPLLQVHSRVLTKFLPPGRARPPQYLINSPSFSSATLSKLSTNFIQGITLLYDPVSMRLTHRTCPPLSTFLSPLGLLAKKEYYNKGGDCY